MRNAFCKTSNVNRLLAAFSALKQRGAEEACLLLVDGLPGLGKSEAVEWWTVQNGAVLLRAKAGWTQAWMLRDLLGELKVVPGRSCEIMFRQALEALSAAARAADMEGRDFGVVIDEVDHIARSREVLETLRDLSDLLEMPFVLVGMDRVRAQLARFPQIASRVSQPVEFRPVSLEDTRALASQLCEAEVADDLVAFIHRASGGLVREIKEALAAVERFARRNPSPVTLAGMAGQPLMNDRKTGRPILVPPSISLSAGA
ncbi:AAA family ATPase [Azospirillum sp. RWY-5-1]|uniref:AAA family ATPase n=1 Tax=Azospirillum oleiclasticum TaxID=2735135 RepID=A0ABX2TMG6_9PROT|nr:AAA family ATPase [Azospirillum oleiclasticum]NYZ17028.1 AAA family ATPase [Azospirillum oleiclasticum]NYZ24528.1 AAA family ATPase [Azospirillum oleiclasticum]